MRHEIFLLVERQQCLHLQNAGKHISATIEFQNVPVDHSLGVKSSCLLVQNLNEMCVIALSCLSNISVLPSSSSSRPVAY